MRQNVETNEPASRIHLGPEVAKPLFSEAFNNGDLSGLRHMADKYDCESLSHDPTFEKGIMRGIEFLRQLSDQHKIDPDETEATIEHLKTSFKLKKFWN